MSEHAPGQPGGRFPGHHTQWSSGFSLEPRVKGVDAIAAGASDSAAQGAPESTQWSEGFDLMPRAQAAWSEADACGPSCSQWQDGYSIAPVAADCVNCLWCDAAGGTDTSGPQHGLAPSTPSTPPDLDTATHGTTAVSISEERSAGLQVSLRRRRAPAHRTIAGLGAHL